MNFVNFLRFLAEVHQVHYVPYVLRPPHPAVTMLGGFFLPFEQVFGPSENLTLPFTRIP